MKIEITQPEVKTLNRAHLKAGEVYKTINTLSVHMCLNNFVPGQPTVLVNLETGNTWKPELEKQFIHQPNAKLVL